MKKVPTEKEVRRFFQESYYVTMNWNSESQITMHSTDLTRFVYPKEAMDDDD